MKVQVNSGEWQGLSAEDQTKIKDIIEANFNGAKITSDPGVPLALDSLQKPSVAFFGLDKPLCQAACGMAEAAAVAACATFTGPALPICIAIAHAAGNLCRKRC